MVPFMWLLFLLLLFDVIAPVTHYALAQNEDPITIKKILEDPDTYHMESIYVQGTVVEVKALEPYTVPSGAGCYGAYTFTLKDKSGSLPVVVLGICGTPLYRPPPLSKGDHVLVQANIHAPGHAGYFKGVIGAPIPNWPPRTVQAIASNIQPAPE